ncbi:MAG: glycoside hydrolase family 15 protein, partial [Myxococcota bacterium]
SASVFGRILDADKGGSFTIAPDGLLESRRRYVGDTNVLETTIETGGGEITVTDCMPVGPFDPERPTRVKTHHALLRKIECTRGEVDVRVTIAPRFEYAALVPRFRQTSKTTAEILGGADALWITATRPIHEAPDRIRGTWLLKQGDSAWVQAEWSSSHTERSAEVPGLVDLRLRLEETLGFWQEWIKGCRYDEEHADLVRRSALVLKALTYAPTGAIVAAPTTSLPEEIGGVRNWDYRYTWVRDCTLTLTSLSILGFRGEADAFKLWIERTGAGRSDDLQIMYSIEGHRLLPEIELEHLAGHRDSKPVRIGNGAFDQRQLDMYGQLLQASYLYGRMGGTLTESNWKFLAGLADAACEAWRDPDQGIWEVRDEPRHFTHSKLYCWVALDRAVKVAKAMKLPGGVVRWAQERDAIHDYILKECATDGWFSQAAGFDVADASTLLVPALGLVPARHPLALKTIEILRQRLESDGMVHRYDADDGLEGGEGAFLLCSFWLLDAMAHAGQLDEAEKIFDKLVSLANDVGLYAEEVDIASGEALGNFPQAFTHMAIVTSCMHLAAARKGEIPRDDAYDFSEHALMRLLEKRGATPSP